MKRNNNESMFFLTPKVSQNIVFLPYRKQICLRKEEMFKQNREWEIEQKTKGRLWTDIAIKKKTITSIRKHTNEYFFKKGGFIE